MAFNNSIGFAVSGSSTKIVGSHSSVYRVLSSGRLNRRSVTQGGGAQSGNLAQGTRNHRSAAGLVHYGLGLGLAGLVLCETRSCQACRHNDLEGHSSTFQVLFIVSLFCVRNITTVEINYSGVHLLKS